MEEKKCCVCGKPIKTQVYYSVEPQKYVCDSAECFETYYWQSFMRNYKLYPHDYAIIDGAVYVIGTEKDEPRGFSGRKFQIEFSDHTFVVTYSLWYKGKIPETIKNQFPDNARFVE